MEAFKQTISKQEESGDSLLLWQSVPESKKLKVHDIMCKEDIRIYRDDSLENVQRIMQWEGLSHACVFDHNEELVGIVNYQEIKKIKDKSHSVFANIHSDFHKIYGLLDAEKGSRAVASEKYHCMPVFENKRIIGILNYENLLDPSYFN